MNQPICFLKSTEGSAALSYVAARGQLPLLAFRLTLERGSWVKYSL